MNRWVAVVLPGASYGPVGAVLRLPCLVLEGAGAEVAVVEYPERAGQVEAQWLSELRSSVVSQVRSATESASRITFVAKSLGTLALASLGAELPAAPLVEAVWLTPLFGRSEVRRGATELGLASLLVAGGADAYHDPEHHEAVRAALDAASLVIPGVDHALERPGDAPASLDGWRQLVDAVTTFVRRAPAHA